jgi:hypothetical protein
MIYGQIFNRGEGSGVNYVHQCICFCKNDFFFKNKEDEVVNTLLDEKFDEVFDINTNSDKEKPVIFYFL